VIPGAAVAVGYAAASIKSDDSDSTRTPRQQRLLQKQRK
jgi:hypothetical protein